MFLYINVAPSESYVPSAGGSTRMASRRGASGGADAAMASLDLSKISFAVRRAAVASGRVSTQSSVTGTSPPAVTRLVTPGESQRVRPFSRRGAPGAPPSHPLRLHGSASLSRLPVVDADANASASPTTNQPTRAPDEMKRWATSVA